MSDDPNSIPNCIQTGKPTYADICSAAKQLKGNSIHTPILCSPWINNYLGSEVYFKCENLQHIGAFKYRGAFNAISRLSAEQKANGVIAFSSGNHAQAVARVCQLLGIEATIVMPNNAPSVKRKATESYGAKVVEYDFATEDREAVARSVNKQNKLSLIPPFNHPHIIAGQGTAALELIQAQPQLEQILVPCGGGGLLSGTALAVKGYSNNCRVIGVEPKLGDDATQSFNSGKIVTIDPPDTIADGTRTVAIGDITFAVMQEQVDAMVTVSEEMIKEAVRLIFYHLKQVVEPSGALGLAALLSGECKTTSSTGIVISGGNVDGETMSAILGEKSIL